MRFAPLLLVLPVLAIALALPARAGLPMDTVQAMGAGALHGGMVAQPLDTAGLRAALVSSFDRDLAAVLAAAPAKKTVKARAR